MFFNIEAANHRKILTHIAEVDLGIARRTLGSGDPVREEVNLEKERVLSHLCIVRGTVDESETALMPDELDAIESIGKGISWINPLELLAFQKFILKIYIHSKSEELADRRAIDSNRSRSYLLKYTISHTVTSLMTILDLQLPLRRSIEDYKIEFLERVFAMKRAELDAKGTEVPVTTDQINEALKLALEIDWSSKDELKKLQELANSFTGTTDLSNR